MFVNKTLILFVILLILVDVKHIYYKVRFEFEPLTCIPLKANPIVVNSIEKRIESKKHITRPFKHEYCKYPFKDFISEFDRIKYLECIVKTEIYNKHEESNSFKSATRFYKKQYGIPPPVGFDEWYSYARSKGCRIDHYDDLMLQLNPLRSKANRDNSIKELIEELIYALPNNDQVKVYDFLKNKITENQSELRSPFISVISEFVENLPAFKALVNTAPVPFVLNPSSVRYSTSSSLVSNNQMKPFEWKVTQVQDLNFITYKLKASEYLENISIQCKSAYNISSLMQGFGPLMTPSSFIQTLNPYPVLSTSNYPCLSSDIIIPDFDQKVSSPDIDVVAWEDKINKMIWRGDTSGSTFYNFEMDNFMPNHVCSVDCTASKIKIDGFRKKMERSWFWNNRQRFVSYSKFHSLTDAAFIEFNHMDRSNNEENSFFYWTGEKIDIFLHKYLISLDGFGADTQLLKMLQSNSLVFSADYSTSWYSQYTIPFYHYIPIDPGYSAINATNLPSSMHQKLKSNFNTWFKFKYEHNDPHLYNPLGFNDLMPKLLHYMENDDLAHHISIVANDFASKNLGKNNMDCYLYRVLLELARISQD
eukprot:NODE_240_length_13260_cov_0.403313.p2 type:complete len:591 gc:universal NODE_240_length_13260_cov_0.403313:7457-9229(+)